ncbi:hypothetical protein FQN53_004389, partial [Emmonsiellopsis sp. PD_33]
MATKSTNIVLSDVKDWDQWYENILFHAQSIDFKEYMDPDADPSVPPECPKLFMEDKNALLEKRNHTLWIHNKCEKKYKEYWKSLFDMKLYILDHIMIETWLSIK